MPAWRVWAVCLVFILAVIPAMQAVPEVRAGGTRHGTVEALLAWQASRLGAQRHLMGTGSAVPRVRLEVVSSRDVSATIRALGGEIRANVGGRVIAAELPAGQIYRLARQPGVTGLFAVDQLHPDLSPDVMGANTVWRTVGTGQLPVKGRGVLVGIVDGGIDYWNPDFIGTNGRTRIRAIWDQTTAGTPPSGFSFGTLCDRATIEKRTCPERDSDGHGTLVAGIAAGNGRSLQNPQHIGIAPETDIAVVKTDGASDNVIAAWQFLLAKARSLHEPVVINTSLGSVFTPHDGSSPIALALDRLAGHGRIFVASAGNDGHQSTHTSGTLHAGQTSSLDFTGLHRSTSIRIGVFFREGYDTAVTLTNTDTGETFSANDSRVSHNGVQVTIATGQYNHAFWEVYVTMTSSKAIAGHYRIALTPGHVASVPRYDAWTDPQGVRFARPDESDTVETPAVARSAIAVGDYATQVRWTGLDKRLHYVCQKFLCHNGVLKVGDIAATSSAGPAADGRQKPDVAAPGTIIGSSLSRSVVVCRSHPTAGCVSPAFIGQSGRYMWANGTSMSAPFVSGVVALMLQIDPDLRQQTVTSILRSTARHDRFTGQASWSDMFGAGKIDPLAALRAVPGAEDRRP